MKKCNGVSRRSFLKGAAGAGLSAAALSMLAGCSPAATSTKAEESAAAASGASGVAVGQPSSIAANGGVAPSWLGEKPEVPSDIAKTIDCDLLVIGGGNSGIVAARKAAELGAKVVVMEKQPQDTWSPIGCDCGTIKADSLFRAHHAVQRQSVRDSLRRSCRLCARCCPPRRS